MVKKKSKTGRDGVKYRGEPIPAVQQKIVADAPRAAEATDAISDVPGPVMGETTSHVHEKNQQIYADVRAQREARRGRARKESAGEDAPAGYVRRSSLYLAVALALVAGLFVGSLLPGMTGHNLSGSSSIPSTASEAGQPASASQAVSKDDAATRLASHILEFEEAVRKNPNDVAAWVQLGNLYFDSGKAPQSINAYERALLLRPDDANVLTDLGVMYREVGKYELAVQAFRNASKVDPKHQNALFNRGVVLFFDLKRKEEGRKVWQELLVLNPQAKAPDGKPLKDMLRNLK